MILFKSFFFVIFLAGMLVLAPGVTRAQQGATAPPPAADAAVLAKLCFQCHSASMWSDHRQDRRAWEGVLYRMVGRGALWTEDEIRQMTNALVADFGPQSIAAPVSKQPGK